MVGMDWTIMGVIVGVISVLVAIVFGIWQIWKMKGKEKKEPETEIKQESKTDVYVHNVVNIGTDKQEATPLPANKSKSVMPPKTKPQKEEKVKSTIETLLDETLSVPPNSRTVKHFDLRRGDRITGNAEETRGRRFSLYVMDEENYHEYQNDEEYRCEKEYEDIVKTHIFVDIPYDDTWYIVFDTTYKQVPRWVKVKIQKK